ncbi:MAG: hypothetical protein ACXWP0_01230 [Ktedonobacterales bacterium]
MGDLLHARIERFLAKKNEHRNLNRLAEYVLLSRALIRTQMHESRADRKLAEQDGAEHGRTGYAIYQFIGACYVTERIERAMHAAIGEGPEADKFDAVYPEMVRVYRALKTTAETFALHEQFEETDGLLGAENETAATGSIPVDHFGALTHGETCGARDALNACLATVAQELAISFYY